MKKRSINILASRKIEWHIINQNKYNERIELLNFEMKIDRENAEEDEPEIRFAPVSDN